MQAQVAGQTERMPPAVLVVGAGCVGQVFGHYLARGGARLTFFVRPRQREATARGFTLYPLNRWRPGQPPSQFSGFDVVSSPQELAGRAFDQVYLTVASSALDGSWLGELLGAIGDATLISLQPDAQDHARIRAAGARPERLVLGAIGLVAYAAPLPGETRFAQPGTAYWLPPFVRSLFSGPAAHTAEAVAALRRGGLPVRRHRDVESALAFPNAVGMTYLTALEAAGWSARALARSDLVGVCARAVREAIGIVKASDHSAPLGIGLLAWPSLMRLGLWCGARAVPFPLEPYLKQHFTKVGAQTRLIFTRLIASGQAVGAHTGALTQLAEALPQAVAAR